MMMPRTLMISHQKSRLIIWCADKRNNPVPTGETFKKHLTNILLNTTISEPRVTRMTLKMPRNLPNHSELRIMIMMTRIPMI